MFTYGDGNLMSMVRAVMLVAVWAAMAGAANAQPAPSPAAGAPTQAPAPAAAKIATPPAGNAAAGATLPARSRFVALSTNQVPMRRGPGVSYEIAWNYVRLGMPMQVVGEVGDWLEVKDWRDSQGWVLRTHVSNERRVIVTGPAAEERLLRERPSEKSEVKARVQVGVIGRLIGCEGTWCELAFPGSHQGWMQKDRLWGVSDADGR